MAQRFVAPGVFTEENDLSYLGQGVAEIGGAFIGPTSKGPAFKPTVVQSADEFKQIFGDTSLEFYTPYAATNYLSEASRATIVRILGLSGYASSDAQSFLLSISGSGGKYPIGLLHPSRVGVTLATGSIGGIVSSSTQFTLVVSGASGASTFNSMSVDPDSTRYFAKVLGTSPATSNDAFVYTQFPKATSFVSGALTGTAVVVLEAATGALNFSGSAFGSYSHASTPWIRSQTIGSIKYNLFKVHTISDGTSANTDVKISIAGIRPAPIAGNYGTFSLLVRAFDDTDSKVSVLEQFDNLTLDPDSPNFFARRIGTAKAMIDANGDVYLEGDWPNNSRYIYVEPDSGIESVPTEALPYGFAALNAPLNRSDVPAPSYVVTRYTTPVGSTSQVSNNRVYYGLNTEDDTTLAYLNGLPSGSSAKYGVHPSGSNIVPLGGLDVGFDLLTSLSAIDGDVTASAATNLRKFTVALQGGFDGQNPAVVRNTGADITSTNTQGFDLSTSTSPGTLAYLQAIRALANPESWDINLLTLPGVVYSQHSYVVSTAITMVEDRADCFFIMDSDILGQTVDGAVNTVEDLDTNYAATYYPWVKIRDVASNKTAWVPPSVVLPEVFAFNDRVGAEWTVPAGLTRGGIGRALQVRSRLSQNDKEVLYDGHINPIVFFNEQGITVWGQKTLQQLESALDRINVRRLLIAVKKYIASASRYLVFEQNVEATRNLFLNIVNPYLATVQERFGLYDFRVIMDDTNNTPDLIDRNILVGTIQLKPTKAVEYISLTFNVLPTGATFSE